MPDRAPEIGEYNGNPTITIFAGKYKGEDVRVTLGIRKAKAIVDHIDHLYKFVKDNEK